MDINKEAIKLHKELKGKIEVVSRTPIKDRETLSLAYTPGVAAPCLEIAQDESLAYEYTRKSNLVAVITDGTAVLGLGDIGPSAAMPVMEGKCALFKEFADVDAFPICIDSKDTNEIINTIYNISKSFGGINLEDISAPRCFEIEKALIEKCGIPVFHDDQHGTAIIVAAAVINSAKLMGKEISKLKIVLNGAGSAGIAIAKQLLAIGVVNLIICDKDGALVSGDACLNSAQADIARQTINKIKGSLKDVLKETQSDVFVGVSAPNLLNSDDIKNMADKCAVFAMANPVPEIMPEEAKKGGAYIIGTGRSDFPNQINNVLAFPGIFKGALAVRARKITDEMKIAASFAIANLISDDELNPEYILPSPFDKRVVEVVAKAVADTAIKQNLARI